MKRRIPIRWSLTLWYSALLMGTLVLFGIGIYAGLAHVLYDGFAEQVRQDASLAQSAIQVSNGTLQVDPSAKEGFDDHEHMLRVLDATGSIVLDTGSSNEQWWQSLGTLSTDQTFRLQGADGVTYVIATAPIESNGKLAGQVEVAVSRADVDQTLRSIGIAFVVALPVLLATASAGGYLISGRALAPVASITQMAATIRPDDLGARIDLDLPDDELGRLARTFDAMLARIDTAFERQRRFTGDAAHELRTPLSLMRGQVDLTLSRTRSAAEYQEALMSMRGDIQRLTSVVSILLALSRAEAGTLTLEREPVELAELISLVLAAYAPQSAEMDVTLRDQSTPITAEVDSDLVVQMLVDLLDNALAHTPPGGVIAVGADRRDTRVCLWVEDSGSGIAPEHLDRIFERFYRVDQGRSRREGGAGLGLAFCRAIAEAHGGQLTVESRPGHGARFLFSVPSPNSPLAG